MAREINERLQVKKNVLVFFLSYKNYFIYISVTSEKSEKYPDSFEWGNMIVSASDKSSSTSLSNDDDLSDTGESHLGFFLCNICFFTK